MASGGKREGAGRPEGSVNKDFKKTRETFSRLVDDNSEKFQEWIDKVADTNPAKALELVINLSEFVLPKLSRTEAKVELKDTTRRIGYGKEGEE